ncbi:MAG: hypothetical protein ISS74_01435 [Planctomycetes bacterium]|nr:hypothetical protein [Planctomycetota bacterium]
MCRARKNLCFVCLVVCLAACAAGCFPFPFALMRWSEDGSVGVLLHEDGWALVDGKTGQTTAFAKPSGRPPEDDADSVLYSQIPTVPNVSADGNWLVYATNEPVEGLDETLRHLPASQVEMIEHDALLAGIFQLAAAAAKAVTPDVEPGTTSEALEHLSRNPLAASPTYCNLVSRYLRDRGEPAVRAALPPAAPEDAKVRPFPLMRLFLLPIDEAGKGPGRLIAANSFGIVHPRLSPDGRFVAYLSLSPPKAKDEKSPGFDLWVSSLKTDPVITVRVAQNVAYGYTWRPDSRAVACLMAAHPPSSEALSLAVLTVIQVADAEGSLVAKEAKDGAEPTDAGTREYLVGTLFGPFAVVAYHHTGRLLFSGAAFILPASELQEPRLSIFAFDPITRTVADVLPSSVSQKIDGPYFEISPDGNHLLIPIMSKGEMENLMVYNLGESQARGPLADKVKFSEVGYPAWKGPDHIACWVKPESALLNGAGLGEIGEHETVLVEVDLEGNLVRVLIAPKPPTDKDKAVPEPAPPAEPPSPKPTSPEPAPREAP